MKRVEIWTCILEFSFVSFLFSVILYQTKYLEYVFDMPLNNLNYFIEILIEFSMGTVKQIISPHFHLDFHERKLCYFSIKFNSIVNGKTE